MVPVTIFVQCLYNIFTYSKLYNLAEISQVPKFILKIILVNFDTFENSARFLHILKLVGWPQARLHACIHDLTVALLDISSLDQ